MAVGLEGFEKRSTDMLSGGQLQRTLFARVLVQDADLIRHNTSTITAAIAAN